MVVSTKFVHKCPAGAFPLRAIGLGITEWLTSIGLERYLDTFRENEIDIDILAELDEPDLKELGIALGDRKRLRKALSELANHDALPSDGSKSGAEPTNGLARGIAERRHLTVMFIDLVGSTSISGRLDPEEMRAVMRNFQTSVAAKVSRYGGYVAQFMGDGVLAYFGFPHAREHAAESAVTAGLSITRDLGNLRTPDGERIMMRVGIATGHVIVGELVEEQEARQRDVIGQTPNLAARLQALADPGGVVIADDTRDLIGDLFELTQIEAPPLKGIDRPVEVYEVISERMIDNRFDAYRAGRSSPMIGREREWAVLLKAWNTTVAGESQLVNLSGEAGIGKSLLTSSLTNHLVGETHHRVTIQCSPHYSETVLYPIVQQICRASQFTAADTNEIKFERLERHFAASMAGSRIGSREAATLLARVLELDVPATRKQSAMSAQQLRERTLLVISRYILSHAQRRPLLLIVEDLHWIDPTSLEVLRLVLSSIETHRVLLLVTSRTDSSSIMSWDSPTLEITLNRLNVEQAEKILDIIAEGHSLPLELRREVVAKADGIPLFVEELTKTILASDQLELKGESYEVTQPGQGISIPSSLHDSLMARLDQYPTARNAAQMAACIGRTFSRDILSAIFQASEVELDNALNDLLSAEVIDRHTILPDSHYIFRHGLVCDTARGSLLRSDQKTIHARIVDALLAHDTPPEVLAYHHEQADQPLEAAQRLLEAGRKSLGLSAGQEAISFLSRGVALVEPLAQTMEIDQLRFRLYASLGTGFMLIRSWGAREVEESYSNAMKYSDAAQDVREKIWILWGIWVFRQVRGNIDISSNEAARINAIAEESEETDARLIAQMVQLQLAFYQGRFSDSIKHGENLGALYQSETHDALRDNYSVDLKLVWQIHSAQAHLLLGDMDRAKTFLKAGLERADDSDHMHSKIWATIWGANFHLLLGDTREILDAVPQAIEAAEHYGFDYVSGLGRLILAAAKARDSQTKENIAGLDDAIAKFRSTGADIATPYFEALKAQALNGADKPKQALKVINEVLARIGDSGERWMEPLALKICGDILISSTIDDRDAAKSAYERASAVASNQGTMFWVPQIETAVEILENMKN